MIPEADALRLAKAAYDGSTNYFDSNIRQQLEDDLRRFQGVHPAGSKYNSSAFNARSKLFRPKTRTTIRKNEAIAAEAFFSTLDVVAIEPWNKKDDFAVASAEVMQQLLQYRLTVPNHGIPWFLILLGAYQDAQVTGMVASYQYWEYDAQRGIDRPQIDLLPLENVRFDPAAKWYDVVGTSPYLIRLVPMYVKDVEARMRTRLGPNGETVPARWRQLTRDQIRATKSISLDPTRLVRQGQNRTDPTDTTTELTEYSIVWVHENFLNVDGQEVCYFTLGTEHLLSDPEPLKARYWHGVRPIAIGFSVIETHKTYPGGTGRLGKDLQTELNELVNSRMDNVKFVLNKRYFVKRNAQVDTASLSRNVPGSSTLMNNPKEDVEIVDTPDVTSSAYQEQDRLMLDYDDLTGVFSQSSVQSNRQLNETVGGMNLLSSTANQVSGYQLRTFVETWVEPVLRQLIKLEQHYESDERILALCAQKAEAFLRTGMSVVTDEMLAQDLLLTVNVGMGATNPHDKINTLTLALRNIKELLVDGILEQRGLRAEELIKEVLGAIGFKDGGRFFDAEGEDPRVEMLMKMVQDLQAQLAAKKPPELIAAEVRKLDAEVEKTLAEVESVKMTKVKTGVEAAYGAMQAGEVIASVPQVAPIADIVMKAAGYVTPTPPGIDPNFPIDAAAAMVPGSLAGALPAPVGGNAIPDPRTNTSPMEPPVPASTGGARSGMETKRFDGAPGSGGAGAAPGGSRIPPRGNIGQPEAGGFKPRWFQEWDGQQRSMREGENAKRAEEEQKRKEAEGEKQRKEEDTRKLDDTRRKATEESKKAAEQLMKQLAEQVSREIERAIKPLERELAVMRSALDREPPEREEPPPPVITVEPHIYIDKGGGAKVMEITAPSGQKYKGSIKDDKA